MEFLKSMINNLISNKNELAKYGSYSRKDLITLTCLMIQKKYMLLPPTEKNLKFITNISKFYPNLRIINECNLEERKSFDLHDLLVKITSKDRVENLSKQQKNKPKKLKNTAEVLSFLKENCIIIKKNEELVEYFDSAKIANILSADKKFVIKQIGFFGGRSPSFHCYSSTSLTNDLNRYLKKDKEEFEFLYLNVGQDQSISVGLRSKLNLKLDINEKDIATLSLKNKMKKNLQEKVKEKINFPFSNKNIYFSSRMTLYVPLTEKHLAKTENNNISYSYSFSRDRSGLEIFSNKKLHEMKRIETTVELRKVPLEEFYEFAFSKILDKEKITI